MYIIIDKSKCKLQSCIYNKKPEGCNCSDRIRLNFFGECLNYKKNEDIYSERPCIYDQGYNKTR